MNVEELILAIEKRPLMYVEYVRIDYIYYLIKGYLGDRLTKKHEMDIVFHSKFYQWVLKWANENTDKKFDRRASFYWYNILTEISVDEKEAVDLFFKLSKEFFYEYKNNEIFPFLKELKDLVDIHDNCTANGEEIFCFKLIKEIVDGEVSKADISEKQRVLAQKQLIESLEWFQSIGVTIEYKEKLMEVIS